MLCFRLKLLSDAVPSVCPEDEAAEAAAAKAAAAEAQKEITGREQRRLVCGSLNTTSKWVLATVIYNFAKHDGGKNLKTETFQGSA